jgi:hypothetical protein
MPTLSFSSLSLLLPWEISPTVLVIASLPLWLWPSVHFSLTEHDRYLVYEVCGRFLPISPVTDQQLGGLVIWIAGGFTIGVVFLIVFARMLAQGERAAAGPRVAKPALTK